jgi:hypothetical protein
MATQLGDKRIKVWMFDCDGQQIIEEFDSIKQAETFADNHGLQIWKVK